MKKLWNASCPFDPTKPDFLRSRTRRPERRDAKEHRQCILATARLLFAEHGVEAVSMHQIAQAANVGQGTLYRRYANKGELCMDLLHERHEQFVADVTTVLEQSVNLAALERLEGVVAHFIDLLEEQGSLLCPIAISGMRGLTLHEDEMGSPLRSPFYAELHSIIVGLFTEAIEQGELVALDCIYTADALLANLHPILYRFQREERGFSPQQILHGLRRIYIYGVKPAVESPQTAMEER